VQAGNKTGRKRTEDKEKGKKKKAGGEGFEEK